MRTAGAVTAVIAAGLVSVIACVSFDLDSRRYRCDGVTNTCDVGFACNAEGYCAPIVPVDAATGDVLPNDGALGEICNNNIDDDNDGAIDCADTECPGTATCGTGCMCVGGIPKEVACGDGADNDSRDGPDCQDPDCSRCAGSLVCCADGGCRPTC